MLNMSWTDYGSNLEVKDTDTNQVIAVIDSNTGSFLDLPSVAKRKAKRENKQYINKKWVKGEHYILKGKPKDGSNRYVKEYVCIGYCYSIKEQPMNIVVMKQVAGPQTQIFTLNKQDCSRLHIKYEQGLQVFTMEKNFIKKK